MLALDHFKKSRTVFFEGYARKKQCHSFPLQVMVTVTPFLGNNFLFSKETLKSNSSKMEEFVTNKSEIGKR
jgi:hypothetical protein